MESQLRHTRYAQATTREKINALENICFIFLVPCSRTTEARSINFFSIKENIISKKELSKNIDVVFKKCIEIVLACHQKLRDLYVSKSQLEDIKNIVFCVNIVVSRCALKDDMHFSGVNNGKSVLSELLQPDSARRGRLLIDYSNRLYSLGFTQQTHALIGATGFHEDRLGTTEHSAVEFCLLTGSYPSLNSAVHNSTKDNRLKEAWQRWKSRPSIPYLQ